MSSVSSCPRCSLPVSLPASTASDARVKCPLCAAEYVLQEALDRAPPELIVLEAGTSVPSMAESSRSTVLAAGEPLSTGDLPQVQFPDDDEGELGPSGFADESPAEESFAQRLALGDEDPQDGGAIIGVRGGVEADGHTGLAEAASGSGTRLKLFETEEGDIPRSARRSRHEGNAFAEFVKVILGGVLGLAIAYYILLWLGRDPLQVKDRLPTWLPLPSAVSGK
jgi:hypothetical protein